MVTLVEHLQSLIAEKEQNPEAKEAFESISAVRKSFSSPDVQENILSAQLAKVFDAVPDYHSVEEMRKLRVEYQKLITAQAGGARNIQTDVSNLLEKVIAESARAILNPEDGNLDPSLKRLLMNDASSMFERMPEVKVAGLLVQSHAMLMLNHLQVNVEEKNLQANMEILEKLQAGLSKAVEANIAKLRQPATEGAIDNLLRSKLSEITYAWKVVHLQKKVKELMLEKKFTLLQVEEVTANLLKSLKDSSNIPEIITHIQQAIDTRNLNQFVEHLRVMAPKAMEFKAEYNNTIDKTIRDRKEEVAENVDNYMHSIKFKDPADQAIYNQINNILKEIWNTKISGIAHNRLAHIMPHGLDGAFNAERQNFIKLLDLAHDGCAIRENYRKDKNKWFGSVSAEKSELLTQMEKSLKSILCKSNTEDLSLIYKEAAKLFSETAGKISKIAKKGGTLEEMLMRAATKYEQLATETKKQERQYVEDEKPLPARNPK